MNRYPFHIIVLVVFVFGVSSRFFLTGPLLLDPTGISERLLTSTAIEEIVACSQGNVISLDDPIKDGQNIADDVPLALALYVLIKAETDSVIMPDSVIQAESNWFSGDTEWSPPQPINGDRLAYVSIQRSSGQATDCLAQKFSVRID